MNFSLSNLSLTGNAIGDVLGTDTTGIFSQVMSLFTRFYLYMVIIVLALYIYLSIAYSKIGEKAKLGSPGVAWMPLVGPIVTIFETSKKHWWPFLMLTLGYALGILVMLLGLSSSTTVLYIGIGILVAVFLIFIIMAIIWHWKTYEAVGKPGWWILVPVISGALGLVLAIVGVMIGTSIIAIIGGVIAALGMIVHFVLVGIAAWGESEGGNSQNYNQNQVPIETQPERGYEEESYGQE